MTHPSEFWVPAFWTEPADSLLLVNFQVLVYLLITERV